MQPRLPASPGSGPGGAGVSVGARPGGDLGLEPVRRAAKVSLLRWLRSQLRQREPLREHLEASIENDDQAEARRVVARFAFSDVQRRHVERLLDEWERELRRPADDLDAPRAP